MDIEKIEKIDFAVGLAFPVAKVLCRKIHPS